MLLPHQERVIQERKELQEKYFKLRQFFLTPAFTTVPSEERLRLARQFAIMGDYLEILTARIIAFEEQ